MKDQSHYLLRLLYGQTSSIITNVNCWLELHLRGLFRSSILVIGVEKVTNVSPEIDSGFSKLLERDDEVMAARNFQIQEDLLFHFCRLVVPPCARVKSQMTTPEVKKTKEVANSCELMLKEQ